MYKMTFRMFFLISSLCLLTGGIIARTTEYCESNVSGNENLPFIFDNRREKTHHPILEDGVIRVPVGRSIIIQCGPGEESPPHKEPSEEVENDFEIFEQFQTEPPGYSFEKTISCGRQSQLNNCNLYGNCERTSRLLDWSSPLLLNCATSRFYTRSAPDLHVCEVRQLTISYKADATRCVDMIDVCYDTNNLVLKFSHHKLEKTHWDDDILLPNLRVRDVNEDDVVVDEYNLHHIPNFDYRMSSSYIQDHFRKIFGVKLFTENVDFVLTRAIPAEDFPFVLRGVVDKNIMQWIMAKALAEHNWKYLENDIRALALGRRPRTLHVYAGTYGVLNLPNVKGVSTDLYLVDELVYPRTLAIPRYVWKVVHEENSGLALAIIASNNPHLQPSDIEGLHHLCPDLCDSIQWLDELQKTRKLFEFGLVSCCHVREVHQIVNNLPDHLRNVQGILHR